MQCPEGEDGNGCRMPDTCMPMKGGSSYLNKVCIFWSFWSFVSISGPVGNDGNECPVTCPTRCGNEDMYCPGGDDGNGCMMPDTCVPKKGK